MKARLRRRVLLAFLSAAIPGLVLMATAAWFADQRVARAMASDRQRHTTHVHRQVEEVRERLRRVVQSLTQDAQLLEFADSGFGERSDELERLVSDRALGADLDLLAFVALDGKDRGKFIASAHLPGANGLDAPAFSQLARSEADVGVVHDFVDGNPPPVVPALVALRAVDSTGGQRFAVYAGVRLDRLLDGLGANKQLDLRLFSPGLKTRHYGGRLESIPSQLQFIALPEGRHYVEEAVTDPGEATRVELRSEAGELAILQQTLRTTWLALAISSIVMAIVVALWLSRRLSLPVRALAEAATRVAAGDLSARVETTSNDEIGVLGQRFNEMTEEIAASRQRLRRAERVAAWQQVAQRVAHEIKNPLFPIRMSMETLAKAFKRQHPRLEEIVEESTRTVLDEVAALDRIVKEFSELARMPPPKRERTEVKKILEHLAGLYRGEERVGVEFVEITATLDTEQCQRALINLIKNALEAGEGQVTLRARADARELVFEVEDSGPGISAQDQERLFTPYYTTKKEGSGLGLAIVDRIAGEHGGSVEVRSCVGQGSTFSIRLPLAPEL